MQQEVFLFLVIRVVISQNQLAQTHSIVLINSYTSAILAVKGLGTRHRYLLSHSHESAFPGRVQVSLNYLAAHTRPSAVDALPSDYF